MQLKIFTDFLNKNVTIVVEDGGINDVYVPTSVVAGYAWNNVAINGSDILQCISAIGRDLNLSVDINVNTLPLIT